MAHAHRPITLLRQKRCLFCLRRLVPNHEWLHWQTPRDQRALDRRKDEHAQRAAREMWRYKS